MLRCVENPIIEIGDIVPSDSRLKVDGVFNAGSCLYKGEVILLLRVAESCCNNVDGFVDIVTNSSLGLEFTRLKCDDSSLDFSDSRIIIDKNTGKTKYLTSLSHLRLAKSKDGINFSIDNIPINIDFSESERWGLEDPRIVEIDGVFYINYTSVSKRGASTSLIKTEDFVDFEREDIIFLPENKDVCLFNEKIDGLYYAYNRPVPKAFGDPDIWISSSPDLIFWGRHRHVLGVSSLDAWDNGRIGGGAPPIKTEYGWLSVYHAADRNNCYCLGAFLTPLDRPDKIVKKSYVPILRPEMNYELEGFFGNVVFTCGTVLLNGYLFIYYGAADDKMCVAKFTVDEIIELMEDYEI